MNTSVPVATGLDFGNQELKRLYTEIAFRMGLPLPVVTAFRKKVYFMSKATDERDLRAWKSLHIERRSPASVLDSPERTIQARIRDLGRR